MYSFTSRVRYSELDSEGDLSLLALFNYLQDCSSFQSESLGLGIGHLRDKGIAWMIAGWNVQVESLPRFCDDIVISTWAYRFSGLLGLRNFTISAPDGTRYVGADSQWFLVDLTTMRPMRVPPGEYRPYEADGGPRLDMPSFQRHIKPEGKWRKVDPVPVTEHHLDSNKHVNNAQYIDIAANAVGEPFVSGNIDVQYRKSARRGDTISPRVYEIQNGHVVDLADPEGGSFALVRFTR